MESTDGCRDTLTTFTALHRSEVAAFPRKSAVAPAAAPAGTVTLGHVMWHAQHDERGGIAPNEGT
jgi:hypothetical protein